MSIPCDDETLRALRKEYDKSVRGRRTERENDVRERVFGSSHRATANNEQVLRYEQDGR